MRKFYHHDKHHILYNEDKKEHGTRTADTHPKSHYFNHLIKIDFDYYIHGAHPSEYEVENDIDDIPEPENDSSVHGSHDAKLPNYGLNETEPDEMD